MSATTSRGVPGIPLGALDAVTDENARLVLQSIIDGLNVRNGFSGTGDMAFVTRGELDSSQSAMSLGLNRQMQSYTEEIRRLGPGQISAAINDLQAQIMESKLFKDLGERVDLIDKPGGIFDRLEAAELVLIQETNQRIEGETALSARLDVMGTRVGTAEAAISTETTQRVNADNAIQQTITTQYSSVNNNLALLQTQQTTTANNVAAMTTTMTQIQAQVGANAAAIAQEQQVRAAADGTLYAQWTLRVDVGGRVSGFGLASDQNISDFIVRADRFSIASPSAGDGITPQMPFIVKTTGSNVGVYIRSAFIEDASITRAKIGDAEVDTLKISGESVTVPLSVTAYGYVPSLTMYMNTPGRIAVFAMCNWLSPNAPHASGYLRTVCNSEYGPEIGISMPSGYSGSAVAIGNFYVGAGYHNITMLQSTTATRNLGTVALFAIGIKR